MKKSNRILIIIGIVIVVLLIIFAGIFHYNIGRNFKNNREKEQAFSLPKLGMETKSFQIIDFSSIETNGGWDIIIHQGKKYSVKVDVSRDNTGTLEVKKQGNTLYLGFKPGVNTKKIKAKAYITMPVFTGCRGKGALSISFADFSGENLIISFAGGISVKGSKSSYRKLKLTISGGADINLKDVPVKDASVHLNGAANIVLKMMGGVLQGDISGAGMLKYFGTVREQNIKAGGAVKIEQG